MKGLDSVSMLRNYCWPVRHWNDVIVNAYGVFSPGFCAVVFLRDCFFTRFVVLLALRFTFFIFHTIVDALVECPTEASVIGDESSNLHFSGFYRLHFCSVCSRCSADLTSQQVVTAAFIATFHSLYPLATPMN
jgi:hypothetical protein